MQVSNQKEIVLDFTLIEEGGPAPFIQQGEIIKTVLSVMFTGSPLPLQVRGTPKQVDRFAKAIAAEKGYAAAFNKYGLNSPARIEANTN